MLKWGGWCMQTTRNTENQWQLNQNTAITEISAACASLNGQRPDYAHARASSVFSSNDNRTVILTRQDFLPDHTADGDPRLFTFSSNILDFRRSLSSHLKFGSRHEDYSDFVASRAASRPEKLVLLALKTAFLMWNSCQRLIVPSPVIVARVLASNVRET